MTRVRQTVLLDPELNDALESYCQTHKRSISEVVRAAITAAVYGDTKGKRVTERWDDRGELSAWLTGVPVAEYADAHGMSRRSVWRQIHAGKITATRRHREWRVRA